LDDTVDQVGQAEKDKPGPDDVATDEDGLSAEEEAQYQALAARRKPAATAADGAVPPLPPAKDPKDMVTKGAMDAAIAVAATRARDEAVTATVARMRGIQEAERIVRPYIGDVVVAMDSAEEVYKLALDMSGVETKNVPPGAFKAMVGMLQLPGAAGGHKTPQAAMDAASEIQARFFKEFPGAVRLIRS
jgi:hypothetical protein